MALVVTFYMLIDGHRLRVFVRQLSPFARDDHELIIDKFKEVARGILVGNGIGSAIQGLLGGIAMAVVGLPAPVFWGAVMTVLAFLPIVGISFVVLPATAYLALTGRYAAAIGFFLFCAVQALIVENPVKARLIGRRARMHDLPAFIGIIGGLAVFGVQGLLFGPLIVALFLTLTELYRERYRLPLPPMHAPAADEPQSQPSDTSYGVWT